MDVTGAGAAVPDAIVAPDSASAPFPFLHLPLELREQVYSNLLLHPLLVEISHCPPYFPWVHHSILLTCRTVHSEARRILYSHNTFYLRRFSRLFLDNIGPTNRNLLRKIRIDWDAREEYQTGFKKVFGVLSGMKNLREVIFWLDGGPDYPSLQCMRGHVKNYGMVDFMSDEDNIQDLDSNGKTKVEFRLAGSKRGLWVAVSQLLSAHPLTLT